VATLAFDSKVFHDRMPEHASVPLHFLRQKI